LTCRLRLADVWHKWSLVTGHATALMRSESGSGEKSIASFPHSVIGNYVFVLFDRVNVKWITEEHGVVLILPVVGIGARQIVA
jgi:hypothetical protein